SPSGSGRAGRSRRCPRGWAGTGCAGTAPGPGTSLFRPACPPRRPPLPRPFPRPRPGPTAFAAIPCFVPSFHHANEKDRQHKLTVFWFPEGGQIRTFNLVKGDLLCHFLIVEGHKQVVIIYHHAVDKAVNQPPTAFQGVEIHFAELEDIRSEERRVGKE